MAGLPTPSTDTSRPVWFATTHWSVVIAARGGTDSTRARAALEQLCTVYWYPLYAFVRRFGQSPHDAQDLVQSFFAVCLKKNYVSRADRNKGRFRSFLLLAFKRFLANEWDKTRTRKRGAGEMPISLDGLAAEQRYALEPTERLSADRIYERRWALTLLDKVLRRLREEQAAAGKLAAFDQLKDGLLTRGPGTSYAELATRLGTSEGAVKVAVHRLRRRYRELLDEEIASTVSSPEEIEEERRQLLAAVSA